MRAFQQLTRLFGTDFHSSQSFDPNTRPNTADEWREMKGDKAGSEMFPGIRACYNLGR